MIRAEQKKHNQKVIDKISLSLKGLWRAPSYHIVCESLNNSELKSSVGNEWTERSLYRMLQRTGYSGLNGLLLVNN